MSPEDTKPLAVAPQCVREAMTGKISSLPVLECVPIMPLISLSINVQSSRLYVQTRMADSEMSQCFGHGSASPPEGGRP